jgi:uroporphyrinogen-III synthase
MSTTIVWTRSKQAWLKDQKLFPDDSTVLHIPTLQIEFEKVDISKLIAKQYDGVIFTSVNAVKAIEIQPKATELLREFPKIITFGKQTAEALASQDYSVQNYQDANTGNELCEILEKKEANKHYLFIGAKKPATDFIAALPNQRVSFLPVYQTKVIPLSAEVQNSVLAEKAIVCLASPSAAEAFRKKPQKALNLQSVCIGPTTAHVAQEIFDRVFTIESPSVQMLAKKAVELAAHSS